MKIVKFTFNMFGENGYLVYSPETREAMVVDPGMLSTAEEEAIDGYIADHDLKVKYLVNTHLHLDHCFGNPHISEKYGVTTMAHPDDHAMGFNLRRQSAEFGVNDPRIRDLGEIQPLVDGDKLTLGNEEIEVIHLPGHSRGGIALYAPADGWVITGDSLFAGSIGRTDFPEGNHSDLVRSVTERLLTLPPQTTVLPGHGPATTIANEAATNPFL